MERTLRSICSMVLLACLATASCGKEQLPARGQLMLVVSTNMQVPGAFDSIRIEVLSYGSVQFLNDYKVGPTALKLPASLGIVAGSEPGHPVTIRVSSSKNGKVRTLREIVTTVPSDRVATLEAPIEWFCLDRVSSDNAGAASSSCVDGQTCVAGACVATDIDAMTLNDYVVGDVFGGGDGTGIGNCFDTVRCFDSGREVEIDTTSCSIASITATDQQTVSVALVVPTGTPEGICGPRSCWVPLDANSESGWMPNGSRIRLPKAACTQLSSGAARAIAVTTSCTGKTASLPTCGEWSSVAPRGGAGAPSTSGANSGGSSLGGTNATIAITGGRAPSVTSPPMGGVTAFASTSSLRTTTALGGTVGAGGMYALARTSSGGFVTTSAYVTTGGSRSSGAP